MTLSSAERSMDLLSGFRRQGGEQPCGFDRILLDALAVLVKRRKSVLGFRIALLGRTPEQFGGATEILRELLAFQVQQAEIVGGRGVAEFGGRCKQFRRFGAVIQPGTAWHVE